MAGFLFVDSPYYRKGYVLSIKAVFIGKRVETESVFTPTENDKLHYKNRQNNPRKA